MGYAYLYNPDNGICTPYRDFVAQNRSDLVPLAADELSLLSKMSVGEIIARRASKAAPTASVEVEVDKAEDEVAKPAKGVSVSGGKPIRKPQEPDIFGNERADYNAYRGVYAPIFPIEKLSEVPDCELVRFAKEAMGRIYEDIDAEMPQENKDEFYGKLREQIVKNLRRDTNKKLKFAKIAEASNRQEVK